MNRRMLRLCALSLTTMSALSLLVYPLTRSGGAAYGAAPGDFAAGGGKVAGNAQIAFAASSGPNGEDPDGHVSVQSIDPNDKDTKFQGNVVCFQVDGKRAVLVYQITQSTPAERQGLYGIIWVEDNGEPVGGQPVDKINTNGYFPTPPPCVIAPGVVNFEGNITVRDR